MLLLLTSSPRTLRAVGGGSAAGPSHSRHFAVTQQFGRFSNRPFRVKRFQTIRRRSVSISLTGSCFSSELAQGPSISWDSRTRRNNLSGGLASRRTVGPSDRANSPHPSSREGHHSTAGWSLGFLLSQLVLYGSHAAATSRVQRNSVPSTQMRCRITANRRARRVIPLDKGTHGVSGGLPST